MPTKSVTCTGSPRSSRAPGFIQSTLPVESHSISSGGTTLPLRANPVCEPVLNRKSPEINRFSLEACQSDGFPAIGVRTPYRRYQNRGLIYVRGKRYKWCTDVTYE